MRVDVRGTPFPPYVVTEQDRRRWDQAILMAIELSGPFEGGKAYDAAFIVGATRSIYRNRKIELWAPVVLARAKADARRP